MEYGDDESNRSTLKKKPNNYFIIDILIFHYKFA
jgi:hypothetical protein